MITRFTYLSKNSMLHVLYLLSVKMSAICSFHLIWLSIIMPKSKKETFGSPRFELILFLKLYVLGQF